MDRGSAHGENIVAKLWCWRDGRGGTMWKYRYDVDEDNHEEKKQKKFSGNQ